MTDFPPNSFKSKDEEPPDEGSAPPKEVRQVGEGRVRKQPLGKKFRGFFFTGDARTAAGYVGTEVMLPAIRDLIYQAGSAMIGRIIFGDTHRHRPYGIPPGYSQMQSQQQMHNYGAYSRMRGGPPVPMIQQQPMMSPQARAHHNFDEIILQSRMEAEEVISQMYEIISTWEVVSVADLYKMVGLASTHVDHKWGWTDVRGSGVQPIRGGGYLLNLPPAQPLQ